MLAAKGNRSCGKPSKGDLDVPQAWQGFLVAPEMAAVIGREKKAKSGAERVLGCRKRVIGREAEKGSGRRRNNQRE